MTPAERRQYHNLLQREVSLYSPADFATLMSPTTPKGGGFQRPPHIDLISETLRKLTEGELLKPDGTPYKRLMVTMPPRHGKSELISKYTPAWFIAKNPNNRVILCSYEADFAASWGRKVRDLLTSPVGASFVSLRTDTKAAHRWETSTGGGMMTAGVGGPISGKPADLLIIDDPVKNADDAASQVKRDSADEWFMSTAFTRLEPGGCVVLLYTRWNEDDLGGRQLLQQPEEWYLINLPAIATGPDPDVLGRLPGEALWPERYNIDALHNIRKTLTNYWWSALYQQTPQIEGGGIFSKENFAYFTETDKDGITFYQVFPHGEHTTPRYVREAECWNFTVADLAATTKTTSDFTVFSTFALTPDKELLLLDVKKVRVQGPEHERMVRESLESKFKPRFVGIEKATFGITLIQSLMRKGLPIRELIPDTDKVTRAMQASALLQAGRIYFPRTAGFLADFEHELLAFPHGAHDDQVDTLSYAAKYLSIFEKMPRREKKPGPANSSEKFWQSLAKKEKKHGKQHPTLGRW
jgi:phage uncharacterized protein (putative large terminase), C-terminal domain